MTTDEMDLEVMEFGRSIAKSAAMKQVLRALTKLAQSDITLIFIGETGTGKDVLAQAVHEHSARAGAPFVVLDCGAVAPNLAESELMGHERGSFTGAVASYAGAFERANGGTLFIDEAGELPLDLQTRLLRVLESRHVRRVGGAHDRPVDVRIIAATNRELETEVAAGRFRADLYFRLAAAVVRLPPLRERREDIPLLARQLLKDLGRPEIAVPPETVQLLEDHCWPGNVRELKNTLARALAFTDSGVLDAVDIKALRSPSDASPLDRVPLAGFTLELLEQAAIKQTLAGLRGNKMQAARSLGIAVSTLYEKIKRYAIE